MDGISAVLQDWSGKIVIDVTNAFMLPPRTLDLRAATDVVRSETLAERPGEFPRCGDLTATPYTPSATRRGGRQRRSSPA